MATKTKSIHGIIEIKRESMFKRVWKSLFTSGLSANDNDSFLSKVIFVNAFSAVGVVSLCFFGITHISSEDYAEGAFEIFCSFIMLVNLILLRRTGNADAIATIQLALTVVVLAFLLVTGGIQNTGIYWYYTFPALAYFLKGRYEAILWIFALYLLSAAIILLHRLDYIETLPYSYVQLRQMLVSLLVVSLLVFFYEALKEKNDRVIRTQNLELREKNKAFEEELTERQRADKALRESEERFKKVITHNADAILVVDQHRIVRFVNPAAERLFSFQHETMIGKHFTLPLTDGDAAEFEIPGSDGTIATVEIRTVEIEWQDDVAYLESLRDITKHKQIEDALRDSQDQLEVSYRREQQRRQFSDTLREVAKIVSSSLEQKEVLELIFDQLNNVITYHRATVMLVKNHQLTVVAGRDKMGYDTEYVTLDVDKYPLNADALQERQPFLLPDVSADPRWKKIGAMSTVRSSVAAPLIAHDQHVGILLVGRRDEIPYSEEDAQTVFDFATQVAIAMHNAQLHAETQERNRRLAFLHELSLAINSTLNLQEILTTACQKLVENFHADHGGIWLFDDTCAYEEVASEFPPENAVGLQIPLSGCLAVEQMIAKATPVAIYDAQHDLIMEKMWDVMRMLGIHSTLMVPLIIQGRVIGSFSLDMIMCQRVFESSEIELAQTIASQLAIAIDNARLLEKEHSRVEQEFETARQIQVSLLPASDPKIEGLDIAGCSKPARQVGGDFYYYAVFDRQHLGIAVGDVSGKGMQAALMMALSFGLLSTEILSTITPAALLTKLNAELRPHTQRSKKNTAIGYVTLLPYNNLPNCSWELRTANAGLVAPLVRHANGAVEWLDVSGLPLGVVDENTYTEARQILFPGSVVILSSDGIIEARNEFEEMYGFERLAICLSSAPTSSAQAILNWVLDDLGKFVGAAEVYDDLTLVVAMVTE